jgi:hypothetical protein
MNEYISRDDVLKAIDYQHEVNNVFESEAAYVQMWETINDDIGIKAADVQPVKHGKWIIDNDYYTCSRCNHQYLKDKILSMTIYPSGGIPYYCPCCGSRMDGEQND